MKKSKLLLPILTGSLFVVAANAQVDVTLTGSTAFRSITIDRAASLYDAGSIQTNGSPAGATPGGCFFGTMSNAIPSLGNNQVTVRLSFSGSAAGMLAVDNSTPIATINSGGTTNNVAPDLALSDVYPESASPPIDGTHFERSILGVIPFVYVKNNSVTGVTNITQEQAILFMTASGVQSGIAFPGTFLGGSTTNAVYLTGRDSGSGTRITVHKDIKFTGSPTLWTTNGAGVPTLTAGLSSAALERDVIRNPGFIGYLGVADAVAIAGNTTQLAYEGIKFSHNNVAIGQYPIWGYQHIVNRTVGLSVNQQAVRDALIAAVTNPGYQGTNSIYTNSFVSLSDMHVERGTDGGTITSLDF